MPTPLPQVDLDQLLAIFHADPDAVGTFHSCSSEQFPPEARLLLAHDFHMTVTVEAFHRTLVDVRVLDRKRSSESYCREIVLTRRSDNAPVQYGIVRLHRHSLPLEVLAEIEAEQLPLGRVLINHGVLRSVKCLELWRVEPGSRLQQLLEIPPTEAVYGRTAIIFCDDVPAIELLEIVRMS